MEVAAWLRELGLERHEPVFRENEIDWEVLSELTEGDLEKLGLPLGPRKKLLKAIAALRSERHAKALRPPVPSAEGERRQVTVLFADLAGYTELTRELGAEAVHQFMGRFFELVDGAVQRYGGTVDKHIGDCVMAVFGAPIAHSNDPERAVRAALEICAQMPALASRAGRAVGVHVGIASGQVVASGTGSAGHWEYTVTGESVNLASRLTDEAGTGAILISDAVRKAVPDGFECTEVGELSVKGFAAPVRVWRLIGLRADRRSPRARPFVGRQAELRQFEGILQACLETGFGQTVHVRGEAGIGKTHLVEEFQRCAEAAGFASYSGLVLDFGAGIGQDAIRMLVRGLLGVGLAADRSALRETAEDAIAKGLVAADRLVYLNDLLDLPQPTELRALYDAMDNAARNYGKRATLAELVEGASRRRPLLVVVEDAHWADRLTLAHLATLTITVAACPAVLVMTSRPEGDPLDQVWRSEIGGSPFLTIDLGPLRTQDAEALASAYVDASAEFATRCVARAAGNPLFLEQLLRNSQESAESSVPGTVQSLVQARIDRLEAVDKQALQAASVFGQRFGRHALSSLLGGVNYDCGQLVAHFLVRPQGEDFLFAHALIRDAVYDSLLSARRKELHRRAAAYFAERDLVLCAEHLDRAEAPDTARAYLEAARQQASEYRYERALQLVERGLEASGNETQQFALSGLRAELLRLLGQPKASIEAYEAALALTEDERERCEAWIGIAAGVRLLGGYAQGIEALQRAEAIASNHHLDHALAQIHYYWGSLCFARAEIDACLEHHRQAFEHAKRAGQPEWIARALSGLGDGEYARGRMRAAMDYYRECIAIAREHGFGQIEVANLYMFGNTLRYLNQFREGFEEVARAAEMAAKVSNRRAEMVGRMLEGEFLVDRGEIADAETPLARAYALATSMGNERYAAYLRNQEARRLFYAGRSREARELLLEGLAISRRTEPRFIGPRLLGTLALIATDAAERQSALAEAERIIESGCNAHNWLWFYRDAIEAALAAREWEQADCYAATLEERTRAEPIPWSDFFIARGRALAVFGRGRRDGVTMAELQRLREVAGQVHLGSTLPALERALAAS